MKLNQKEINYLISVFTDLDEVIENDISHCKEGAESLHNKLFNNTTLKKKTRVTNKMLADYLGVTEQAVKQYPKIKNNLMKKRLTFYKSWKVKKC